jgi:hypothetical protein
VLQKKADDFATPILPILRDLQTQGIIGYRAIARALNARGIQTASGRQWYATTVKKLLQRTHGNKMCDLATDAM